MAISVDWSDLKSFLDDRKLAAQFVETDSKYIVQGVDGQFTLESILPKGESDSDTTDFENNYKSGGNKRIDTGKDFALSAAAGDVNGDTVVNKFGANPSLSTSEFVPVWDDGIVYTYLTSAKTLTINRTSENDKTGGTGALTVEIQGLDGSHNEITETVNMNGTTNVTTTNSFLRVNRMVVLTAGSLGENDGDIVIDDSGNKQAKINKGLNQTLMAIYTVPANKTAFLKSKYWSIPCNNEIEARLVSREENEVFQTKHLLHLQGGYTNHVFGYPVKLEAKADIQLRAKSLSGSCHSVSAGFDLILVDNS